MFEIEMLPENILHGLPGISELPLHLHTCECVALCNPHQVPSGRTPPSTTVADSGVGYLDTFWSFECFEILPINKHLTIWCCQHHSSAVQFGSWRHSFEFLQYLCLLTVVLSDVLLSFILTQIETAFMHRACWRSAGNDEGRGAVWDVFV